MPRKGTEPVNVGLLEEIIRLGSLTHEEIRKRAGWASTINLRRALAGKPLTRQIFRELAEARRFNPIRLLLADSGTSYSDFLHGRDPDPPPGLIVFRGPARFRELRALGDDGRVSELTRPFYYGESANGTLTIRGTEAELIIDNVTIYDDASCSKERFSGRLLGHGSVVDDSVNILYTAEDQTRRLSWAAVCVLCVPRAGKMHDGKIHGYWMTAGHTERGRTVLGILELESTSSEEADGHDQRKG